MPDPNLSAAIKEAYASALVGADDVIHHTLEIWHPVFSTPIRVVRDNRALTAKLEASAPRNAGQVVTFEGYAFEVVPPDQTTTGLPRCQITIDNVSRQIGAQLDGAVDDGRPITVLYRAFLEGDRLVGPETDPAVELTLTSVLTTPLRITATAGYPDLLNARFPRGEYDLEEYASLAP